MKKYLLLFIGFIVFIAIAKGEEANKGYRGYVDFSLGDAYNPNVSQLISTNNMQLYSVISTTHGFQMKNWFVGGGVGYYHSFRDKENMYPIYAAGRYTYRKFEIKPYIEIRAGIVYDPRWIHQVQVYGAFGTGMSVCEKMQVGLRMSMFSRPSRFFTANAAVVLCYEIGK